MAASDFFLGDLLKKGIMLWMRIVPGGYVWFLLKFHGGNDSFSWGEAACIRPQCTDNWLSKFNSYQDSRSGPTL